ncbi:hypothetical protein GGF31_006217 [Allomyces arbusculus]|nr:hypothetical protein GGF31_006217 [Allomyces arbusculus]
MASRPRGSSTAKSTAPTSPERRRRRGCRAGRNRRGTRPDDEDDDENSGENGVDFADQCEDSTGILVKPMSVLSVQPAKDATDPDDSPPLRAASMLPMPALPVARAPGKHRRGSTASSNGIPTTASMPPSRATLTTGSLSNGASTLAASKPTRPTTLSTRQRLLAPTPTSAPHASTSTAAASAPSLRALVQRVKEVDAQLSSGTLPLAAFPSAMTDYVIIHDLHPTWAASHRLLDRVAHLITAFRAATRRSRDPDPATTVIERWLAAWWKRLVVPCSANDENGDDGVTIDLPRDLPPCLGRISEGLVQLDPAVDPLAAYVLLADTARHLAPRRREFAGAYLALAAALLDAAARAVPGSGRVHALRGTACAARARRMEAMSAWLRAACCAEPYDASGALGGMFSATTGGGNAEVWEDEGVVVAWVRCLYARIDLDQVATLTDRLITEWPTMPFVTRDHVAQIAAYLVHLSRGTPAFPFAATSALSLLAAVGTLCTSARLRHFAILSRGIMAVEDPVPWDPLRFATPLSAICNALNDLDVDTDLDFDAAGLWTGLAVDLDPFPVTSVTARDVRDWWTAFAHMSHVVQYDDEADTFTAHVAPSASPSVVVLSGSTPIPTTPSPPPAQLPLYITDTSSLLTLGPTGIARLSTHARIGVPLVVMRELQGLATGDPNSDDERAANVARSAAALVAALPQSSATAYTRGGHAVAEWDWTEDYRGAGILDNVVLETCVAVGGVLVTEDLNLRLKAAAHGTSAVGAKDALAAGAGGAGRRGGTGRGGARGEGRRGARRGRGGRG